MSNVSQSMQASKGRNHWLDFMKLCFILIISFLHTAWWPTMMYGYLPVDFFFIVSGYFIYTAYSTKRQAIGPWFRHRSLRLYPTYITILLIYAAYSLLCPQFYPDYTYGQWGVSFLIESCLLNGLGLEPLLGIPYIKILLPAWYLSVYFWGGAFLYSLLAAKQTRRYVTIILAAIAVCFYGFQFLIWDGTLEIWAWKGIFFMPVCRGLAGMSTGILLGIALQNQKLMQVLENNGKTLNIVAAVAFAVAFYSFFSPVNIEYLAVLCFIILLANAMMSNGLACYFNRLPFARYIPDISLEILLLHKILIPVTVKILDTFGLLGLNGVKYIVYAVLVIAVSYTFNRLIVPAVKRAFASAASLTPSVTR